MTTKNISVIQGDTYTIGIRLSGNQGPIDLSLPDTRLYANVTDISGKRVVARMNIIPVAPEQGYFQVHLPSNISAALRGKFLWGVRYERGIVTKTLAGGVLTTRPGA